MGKRSICRKSTRFYSTPFAVRVHDFDIYERKHNVFACGNRMRGGIMKRGKFCVMIAVVLAAMLLTFVFTACTDERSNDPILGTWLCEDEDSYYAYYVEITVPQSDDEPDFMLSFKMYAAAPDKDELSIDRERPFQLSIDQNTEGKYRLFATFIPGVVNDDYEVEMQGNDCFVAIGDEGIYRSGRHEFHRTTMTLEQFKAQYLNG